MCTDYISSLSGSQSRLVVFLHTAQCNRAVLIRDPAGLDTVVCARVTALTAAAVGGRIIQLWVDILRTTRNMGSPVNQGERHTATLDQESPPKASPQIGVLQ